MTVYKWSQTAATNATADGSINWAEGMSPSAVNDSARAMMAAVAKYADDIAGGNNVTAGTTSAYTLTSKQVFSSLTAMDRKQVSFIVHATNAVDATLNVDGLGAKALRIKSGTGLPVGVLIANNLYSATYVHALSEWEIFSAIGEFPSGTAVVFHQTSAPTGWTKDTGHNDRALRVVSGGISTGGATNFSTVFGAGTTTGGTAITQANLPSYNLSASIPVTVTSLTVWVRGTPDGSGTQHSTAVDIASQSGSSSTVFTTGSGTAAGTVPSGGSGTSHTHTMSLNTLYSDVIFATKD